ncbi:MULTISPECIES: DUF2269 family protein [Phyllobacteriaceae]|jgi:uncharacterized membrane protein|uniref:DUF2269 family protein n=1 Tax=Mesorhizobium hungaricum TaxID=1566387 RepID=A0A1C2DFF4_9HYPH|nr:MULTISPECIES: DUF2269 family protein [Mesorhizobium]MBN9232463.1 DUF2269 family protein [Mesorhizobium sp.]MDQ0330060.1 putative membrane protein [Mesorhizobium sp. YL-MeA3-2017]OCX13395.1 hypothetical protein QV13_28300 [Mesorhizobium hungaricum]
MDWYPIVKLLHVVAATIWVGGGFTMILVGTLADRANDQETLMALLKATAKLGKLLFMPSSLATLVSGLIMTSVWTGFSELWVIIGLCGYAAAFVTGTFVLKPWTQKIAAMLARDGITPAAVALGRRTLRFGKFDYIVMAIVVADMVLKPTLHNTGELTAMAVLMIGGAVVIFARRETAGTAAA